MTTDQILVTTIGLALIGFVYWFFLGKKEDPATLSQAATIKVEGGYSPAKIKIKQNQPASLTFIRKDPSSCLEEVVLPDFSVRKFLPLNEPVTVEITPKQTGVFTFSCGMNMYHGSIEVVG